MRINEKSENREHKINSNQVVFVKNDEDEVTVVIIHFITFYVYLLMPDKTVPCQSVVYTVQKNEF